MLQVTKHTIDRLDLNCNYCLKKIIEKEDENLKFMIKLLPTFREERSKIFEKESLILLGQHNTVSKTSKDGTRKENYNSVPF